MKKHILIAIAIMIILIISVFSYNKVSNYIKKENYNIDSYNDFNRASIIFSLSYYKNFDSWYDNLRYQQRYSEESKDTITSIIYDMKEYKTIDVLKYIYEGENLDNYKENISRIFNFIEYFNYTNIGNPENMLVRNDELYYKTNGEFYIYEVKKKVISIESLNQLFFEFIDSENYDADNYFCKILWNNNIIRNYYEAQGLKYENMVNDIDNEYGNFFKKFGYIILDEVFNILDDFGLFLEKNIDIDKGIVSENIQNKILTDEIIISYKFKKKQSLYNDTSKYSTELYILDFETIWKQLNRYSLPKIYM